MSLYRSATGVLAVIASLVLLAPARAQGTITDATGKSVIVKDINRIVTLGTSTEILFALGLGDKIVAVDTSAGYPAERITKLPKVAYYRTLNAEGILAQRPSVVVTTEDAGPESALDQVRSAGVPVVVIPNQTTAQVAKERILALGKLFQKQAKAEQLVRGIDLDFSEAKNYFTRIKTKPKALFLIVRGPKVLLAAGQESGGDEVLKLAGARNAVTGFTGYKSLTPEAAVAAAPDVIVLLQGGLDSIGGVEGLLKLPGLAATPAGKNKRVVAMDDTYLLGFGPRLGKAVIDLTFLLHPELKKSSK
jgi:iron complex transport system substrate-binding protein